MKEELAVTPDQYMRAKCWGLRHQGLLKAAKAKTWFASNRLFHACMD